MKSFQELIVWQRAHELVKIIYSFCKKFPKSEEFGLKSQMQRSAVSIPSNIAEGFKRVSSKESLHFYNIADGSLEELKYQLILAKDLKYLMEADFKEAYAIAEEVGKLLFGWQKSQKK